MINQLALWMRHYFLKLGIAQEEGQGLTEYAIIIMLVAIVVIGALGLFGTELRNTFQSVVSEFENF